MKELIASEDYIEGRALISVSRFGGLGPALHFRHISR